MKVNGCADVLMFRCTNLQVKGCEGVRMVYGCEGVRTSRCTSWCTDVNEYGWTGLRMSMCMDEDE